MASTAATIATAAATATTAAAKWWTSLEEWKPTMTEFVLYVVIVLVLYIFGSLMYYNSIQMKVKNESACYRDKRLSTSDGSYYATATNQNNEALYKVGYNFGQKSYSVDCACTPGSVANTFPTVDVFNLNTQAVQTIESKMCSCDKQLYNPTSDSIYFSGYPGIVRFMNTASLYKNTTEKQAKSDTTFFDTALNGAGR
jgi:hypothetical protein